VLLGAGLDTFAYRAIRKGLHVFEVDHPATQAWKRARLSEVAIAVPDWVTYAPVDFERETIKDGLARAGFDLSSPAMFAWLGVTPYLTRDAVMATLAFVATLPKGTEIVFDYPAAPNDKMREAVLAMLTSLPTQPPSAPAAHDEAPREGFEALATRVAAAGEPFLSLFVSEELLRDIKAAGFSFAEDLDSDALNARYFAGRKDGLSLRGWGHLMHARV